MISHGHTSKTLDDIEHEDLVTLLQYHRKGRIGFAGEAVLHYLSMQYRHALIQTVHGLAGSKKAPKMPQFGELMPGWDDMKVQKKGKDLGAFFDSVDAQFGKRDSADDDQQR